MVHQPPQTPVARHRRRNSIGFLRFFLAALVICSHTYALGGLGGDPLGRITGIASLGSMAVYGFFALSGYLIAQSYSSAPSLWRFLWHRVLRIFPGFWVCLLVMVLFFAPLARIMEHAGLAGYLGAHPDPPLDYLRRNLLLSMRQVGIAGVFAHNPVPFTVDGSLWTLSYEFVCYLGVALAGVLGLLARGRRTAPLGAAGLVLLMVVLQRHPDWLSRVPYADKSFCEFASYFCAGVGYWLLGERLPLGVLPLLGALALVVAGLSSRVLLPVLLPFAYSYLVLWLAFRLPVWDFDRRGDFSYGLYIYAFPVQQSLACAGVHHHGVGPYLLSSFALTLMLAVLSYHLIEKQALRFKHSDLWQVLTRPAASRAGPRR